LNFARLFVVGETVRDELAELMGKFIRRREALAEDNKSARDFSCNRVRFGHDSAIAHRGMLKLAAYVSVHGLLSARRGLRRELSQSAAAALPEAGSQDSPGHAQDGHCRSRSRPRTYRDLHVESDVVMTGGQEPDREPVGLVVGTVAATPLQFSVAISPSQYLQLDDVVVTNRELPGRPPVRVSGVVTNVEAVHEGARFASDVFLIEQGALPAEVSIDAEVDLNVGGGGNFLSARLMVRLPGLEGNIAKALIDEAEEICPYSKATRGNIEVAIKLF